MKTINSRQNPHIKALTALKKPAGRRAQGKFIVEGLRACHAIVEAGWQPIGLYVEQEMLENAKKLFPDGEITLISKPVMEKLTQATSPSGILGIFKLPKKPKLEKLGSGIVLAEMADPGNMGTLIRTCAAMGFKSVVVIGGVDPWSHKVVQASAGTIAQVVIFSWSWEKLLKNKADTQLVALVARDGQKPESITGDKTLLMVGNEAHGLPKEWISVCDKKVTLPMSGKAESLNAAVAGSVALYLLAQKSALLP